jgi:hypothetical protein
MHQVVGGRTREELVPMSTATVLSTAPPLDRFLPKADVRERHEILVHAPPDLVLDTAKAIDLSSIPAVRAIFGLREWMMGGRRAPRPPRGLVEETLGLGWGVLEDEKGRRFCAGAVCQPWLADVAFQALSPGEFLPYAKPGRVKIAWTLEVEPLDGGRTRFATETRAVATDLEARARFRWYWRFVRPGIVLIRRLMLRSLRREAERRAKTAGSPF